MNLETRNKDGKWSGWVNGSCVVVFSDTKMTTAEEKAKLWLENMKRVKIYPNQVEGTGAPGKFALAIDGDFENTWKNKTSAINWASSWSEVGE